MTPLVRKRIGKLLDESNDPPSKAELLDALGAALVVIADDPDLWAEEALIRSLLLRARTVMVSKHG